VPGQDFPGSTDDVLQHAISRFVPASEEATEDVRSAHVYFRDSDPRADTSGRSDKLTVTVISNSLAPTSTRAPVRGRRLWTTHSSLPIILLVRR
jgi:hypothetical protein